MIDDPLKIYFDEFNARLHPLCKRESIGDSLCKEPLRKWKNVTYTREQIYQYSNDGHPIGWALRSTDLVIDVDVATPERPDKKGLESLPALETMLGAKLSAIAIEVQAPSGGKHFYLTKPGDIEFEKTLEEFPDIDFKTSVGYVVVAGSDHWQGGKYDFSADFLLKTSYERPECPQPLLDMLKKDPRIERVTDDSRISPAELRSLLGYLRPENYRDQFDWQRMLFASHHATGGSEEGFDVFAEWSTSDLKYANHKNTIRTRWFSLDANRADGVTLATLFQELKDNGHDNVVHNFLGKDVPQFEIEEMGDDIKDVIVSPESISKNEKIKFDEFFLTFDTLQDSYPKLREPVVTGVLRRGETANIIASSKEGKTFFAILLSMSVALGRKWLGFHTKQGPVLYLDNELHEENISFRQREVATAIGASRSDLGKRLHTATLRGRNLNLYQLDKLLNKASQGGISPALIVLDAFYRFLPPGVSENDNAQVTSLMNEIDCLARSYDCAFALIHHASKGNQGDKSVTDVGAGAGAFARAADTHLTIRPHENDGMAVLESRTRSFAPMEPKTLRFEFPVWSVAKNVPAKLRIKPTASQKRQERRDQEAIDRIREEYSTAEFSATDVRNLGMGADRAKRLLLNNPQIFEPVGTRPAIRKNANPQQLFKFAEATQ